MVACPLGPGGMGGIDRIMDEVRDELRLSPVDDIAVTFLSTRGQGSIWISPLVLSSFLTRMIIARLSGRLDVVHINLSCRGSTYRKLVVAFVARRLGVATVIHLHGSQYRQFWFSAGLVLTSAITRMFSGASRVVVLGKVWHRFVADKVPGIADRTVILPNATPRTVRPRVPGPDGTVRILFLGRIGARKGVPQLVEALAAIADLPNWSAVLAGDGDIGETVRMVAGYGLSGRVVLPGWVGPDAVASYLAASDVLALPSFDENLPMSVIEGMAAGLAVIATPVGAVEDVITDGETGLLVNPGDSDALAVALRRIVLDAKLRRRLGDAGRVVHRERLEIGPYVRQLCAIWRDAAAMERR